MPPDNMEWYRKAIENKVKDEVQSSTSDTKEDDKQEETHTSTEYSEQGTSAGTREKEELNGTDRTKEANRPTDQSGQTESTPSSGSEKDTQSSGRGATEGSGNNPGEPIRVTPGDTPQGEGGPGYKQPKQPRSFAFQRRIRARREAEKTKQG